MAGMNKERKTRITAACLSWAAVILFFVTSWLLGKYDRIDWDQVLFFIKSPGRGMNAGMVFSSLWFIFGFGSLTWLALALVYRLLAGRFKVLLAHFRRYRAYAQKAFCTFLRARLMPMVLGLCLVSVTYFLSELRVVSYLETNTTVSDFIEERYVAPDDSVLAFPNEKRNLIYIFLESMENTYASLDQGGAMEENIIPELTALACENVQFSNTDRLGGARSFAGTTWTASAMVAQTAGLPIKVPLTADTYGGQNRFIPGITTLGEVLCRQGYNQTLLVGSDAAFAGRDSYFSQHGNYKIVDINSLKAEGRLPADYNVWWGFEDAKLFDYAKEELLALYEAGKPFNFTMLTADTHFPGGYLCRNCPTRYSQQYSNVLACSSAQVAAFVAWIQKQPFYENTVIVLSGDHLTMDPGYLSDLDETYVRTIYNCFINSAVNPLETKNRQFGSFDMFPSTLAAMGVRIHGDRLGLGTDLFSATPTLTEEIGYEELNAELQKKSVFYNRVFLEMDEADSTRTAA